MKAISLAANPRVLTKTIGSKKLRNAGTLPGIVYGNGEPQTVELIAKQFDKAVKSTIAKNFLVELEIDGKKKYGLGSGNTEKPLDQSFHSRRFQTPDQEQRRHRRSPDAACRYS
jgi:large subunit ribosomal protein L25